MIRRLLKPGDRGPTARELNKLIADSTSARNVRARDGVVQQRRGGTIMHPRFQPITEFTGRIEDDDEYSTDARYRVVQLFAANHAAGTWNKHVEFKDLGEGLHVVATNMVEYRPDDKESETHDVEVGTIVKVYALLDITSPQRMNRWVFWVGGGGGTQPQFRVVAHKHDYLECHTWDGEKEGEGIVLVALMHGLRRTVWDFGINGGKYRELSDGTRIKYIYDQGIPWKRTAIIGKGEKETEEKQIVVRLYVTTKGNNKTIGPDVIVASRLDAPIVVMIDGEPVEIPLIHETNREFMRQFEEE